MPTTLKEAQRISEISQEYLPPEKLGELFVRLNAEVGQHTDNSSLKESLGMLAALSAASNMSPSVDPWSVYAMPRLGPRLAAFEFTVEPERFASIMVQDDEEVIAHVPRKRDARAESPWVIASFFALVTVHIALVVFNAAAFLVLPFAANPIVAVPLMTLIGFLTLSPGAVCPLTVWENRLRRVLDMPELKKGFVHHYFIRPITG